MNDGFHALDIVFFAAVAVFLVLRLRSVLGRRTGHEREAPRDWGAPQPAKDAATDNVIDLTRARKPAPTPLPDGPVGAGLAAVVAADPDFTVEGFLSGGRMAFEIILGAYARGDLKALRPLLADEVYRPFADAVMARDRAGETLDSELVGIRSAEIVEARMVGSAALVTVRFVTEQTNVVKDSEGRIVDGDPAHIAEVTDEWTFRRDTQSRDPNWQLAATRAPEDDGA
ncbi:Tim44/TimA family putative adaptor protein [Magnetospirillum sp. UT-4]|uniref:Tim44/TimA family putative adaptor protein n=1 Tax=Magnetospirillum sp. UT-4 TaxID=2681467 RepID=UPI00137F021B|nr:Tim44/TimA family putative adaptor protein [Magnetospirillum sp. UT-4]CAA7621924.1 Mitochondrial import inner membrane translocase, subunit Tim44 [Magnetospirillum sp. UT-4]